MVTGLACVLAWVVATSCFAEAPSPPVAFRLESIRTKTVIGPFRFNTGFLINTGSGKFKLQVLGKRTFRATGLATGRTYGVYELVPGRIIELGDALFTIVDIKYAGEAAQSATEISAAKSASPGATAAIIMGVEMAPFSSTYHDWKIKESESGNSSAIDRKSLALVFRRGNFFCRAGFVMDAEWDETVAGDESKYQNLKIVDGRGWWVSLGGKYPLFREGRWRAEAEGALSYREEEYSLKYGASRLVSVSETVSTNASSGVTTNILNTYDYSDYKRNADLTETLLSVGASLTYEMPSCWMFAGLTAIPFSDTDLNGSIEVDGAGYEMEFERTHPVMVHAGAGAGILGFRCHLEGRVGSEMAVRIGVERGF